MLKSWQGGKSLLTRGSLINLRSVWPSDEKCGPPTDATRRACLSFKVRPPSSFSFCVKVPPGRKEGEETSGEGGLAHMGIGGSSGKYLGVSSLLPC